MRWPKYRRQVPLSLLSLLSIILLLGLTACSDNVTPTPPGTSPTKALTAPTTTSTIASTTTGATGATSSNFFSSNSGKFNLSGASTVIVESTTLESALKNFLAPGITNTSNFALTIYASNDEPSILGENGDKALTDAGYTFHDVRGGQDANLAIRNSDGAGAYTKSGKPDIILEARESGVLTNTRDVPPGVSAEVYQKMIDQVKDNKSVLIVLSGTNLYQSIMNAKENNTTVSTGPTPSPGPTK